MSEQTYGDWQAAQEFGHIHQDGFLMCYDQSSPNETAEQRAQRYAQLRILMVRAEMETQGRLAAERAAADERTIAAMANAYTRKPSLPF